MLADRAAQMIVFATLLTHKNFTQAAKSLGVSVSHVSKQLALLEDSLGVKLVQRTTRTFTPTAEGEQFFLHCQKVLQVVTDAQQEVEGKRMRLFDSNWPVSIFCDTSYTPHY